MTKIQKQKKLEIYLFISFLSKNDAWGSFVSYYNNEEIVFKDNLNTSLSEYLIKENSCDYLECSYDWEETTEGFEFWEKLSYEWEAILEQYENDSADFC